MTNNTDDFLAHYGVKGMKWGQRRTDAQLAKASGADEKPKRKIDKKKVAIAAGVIAGTAAITIGVVVLNKNKNAAGEAFVMDQMKKMGGQASWDVITKIPTTPTKPAAPAKLSRKELDSRATALKVKAGEDAAKKQIQAFASKSMWDIMNDPVPAATSSGSAPKAAAKSSGFQTPSQKRKAGEAAAAEQIKAFAGRSMWDLAADTSIKASPKKTSYSSKAKKADAQLYGDKNAKQIAKKVSKGGSLADARKSAALKSYGPSVAKAIAKSGNSQLTAKVAANVGSGKLKDKRRR